MPTSRGSTEGRLQEEAIPAVVVALLSVTVLPPLGFWSVRIGRRVRAGAQRKGVVDHGIGQLAVVLGWVGIALTGVIVVAIVIAAAAALLSSD
ncbi:MAG: hypothetical protein EA340_12060 [Nitriliruptor sp.]|nr:MAG: hypothetical protein EA340_12060 [Nitriliruptor sp.]